ncbi:MAG: hypothetical protein HY753_06930 [Nitrospirae bacterium]|nr:hypothetical protein [Nitrospirota bacterium]
MINIPTSPTERLNFVLDLAWQIFFEKVTSGRIKINKESSMQLHYSAILQGLGELMCIKPKEIFTIELETSHGKKNIDIACAYNDVKGAVELKCFKKESNRARDIDMYDVLRDIDRLLSYDGFKVKKFICIADHSYYAHTNHSGKANSVSIKNGKHYKKDMPIIPEWAGKWKDDSRDEPITFSRDISFNWFEKSGWYYLLMDLN